MSVGIVIVSHSSELAEGLKKILSQVQPDVAIYAAGGTEDNEIGTSSLRIKAAIEKVYCPDGVIVLVDLGSAVLNTELAIEMLEMDSGKVVICDAPIVEGAYAAVVLAGCGSPLKDVVEVASEAKKITKL